MDYFSRATPLFSSTIRYSPGMRLCHCVQQFPCKLIVVTSLVVLSCVSPAQTIGMMRPPSVKFTLNQKAKQNVTCEIPIC